MTRKNVFSHTQGFNDVKSSRLNFVALRILNRDARKLGLEIKATYKKRTDFKDDSGSIVASVGGYYEYNVYDSNGDLVSE